jgi:hypothetical protein
MMAEHKAPTPDPAAVVEALRKAINALPRHSFLLDANGAVRKVVSRSGDWIDWHAVHALFDWEAIDALVAKELTQAAIAQAKGARQ